MKIAYSVLAIFFGASCGYAEQKIVNTYVDCEFGFDQIDSCTYKTDGHKIVVRLKTSFIASDEIELNGLDVLNESHSESLSITPGTTLINGDMGYISFADINFDSIPDLAITTSFGTPNLYLDYWVYRPDTKRYVAVGNLPKLTIDKESKTLTADVKINAVNYEKKFWKWQGYELVADE
jgi:hypothetical protein